MDFLVAGLGNPGPQHARDRHNVGWMVVDELARRHGGSFKGKFRGRLADVRVEDARLALLEPETYMNESGASIQAAAAFFKISPAQVLVVHDDVDLEIARLQAPGGGLAGHNGLGARSPGGSARRTSFASGSASAGPSGAIPARSPTTCCHPSRRRTMPTQSSVGQPTPSRRSCARGSRRRSAGSLSHRAGSAAPAGVLAAG